MKSSLFERKYDDTLYRQYTDIRARGLDNHRRNCHFSAPKKKKESTRQVDKLCFVFPPYEKKGAR